ncbi:hypothetical protein CLOM_g17761 [Closterium sp. NIES-68]|nr:hypothetical protein CLOM_g17761 [Closterium sp. NIES-68]GJP62056.1 hypothetical protein CLOP_g19157 [Closterium sp. NIES-67]
MSFALPFTSSRATLGSCTHGHCQPRPNSLLKPERPRLLSQPSTSVTSRFPSSRPRQTVSSLNQSRRRNVEASVSSQRSRVPGSSVTPISWRGIAPGSRSKSSGRVVRASSGVDDLQVPATWTSPEVAQREAEWLRESLKAWLDNEYCPEPANVGISDRCAKVYYRCLVNQEREIAQILMQMVYDLESFSFKESFHGPFSSANAAVALISDRAAISID